MITDKIIMSTVETSSSLQRGYDFYRSGRVKNVQVDKEHFSVSARVIGSYYYDVYIYFNDMWELQDFDCDCALLIMNMTGLASMLWPMKMQTLII